MYATGAEKTWPENERRYLDMHYWRLQGAMNGLPQRARRYQDGNDISSPASKSPPHPSLI
jgi:hypothetical protein